ncbi:AMP-binding protein, partial [Mycolicibacterium gadium]|uniref:AMP-binding protein n=1 Tax=Mycolicibacterium gadium TaxID=1794 RepID=UPI0021F369C4
WAQVGERVELIAAGLIALGINPEDRVALAAGTRYEWVVVDFGILSAGAATTTVYPSTNAEDTAFIVANSGSRVVVYEWVVVDFGIMSNRADLPAVEKVVIIDGTSDDDWVITLDELEQLGKQLLADNPTAVTERIAVEKVVIIDGTSDDDWVITLDELEQLGKQLLADNPTAVTER